MRKRISLKFLEGYILIGILGFLFITLTGSYMIESILEQDISESLYLDATHVAENSSVKNNISSSNLSSIQSNLYMISDAPASIVWIINSDGDIIVSTRKDISPSHPIELKGFDPSDWGSNYYRVGDFYGYFQDTYLSVLAPITDNMTTKGYVAIHYRMSDLYQKRGEILFIIQLLFLAVYLMVFLLLLIYQRYVH